MNEPEQPLPTKKDDAPIQDMSAMKGAFQTILMTTAALVIISIALLVSTVVLAVDKSSSTSSSAGEPNVVTQTVTETETISEIVEVPMWPTEKPPEGLNVCEGKKPELFDIRCVIDGVEKVGEQAATNITKGYNGLMNTSAVPLTVPYYEAGLCPVNVHWHLGTEHYSMGEFDEHGTGPTEILHRRKLSGEVRPGFQCHLYDEHDETFTTPYEWKHCESMEVGQTYEVHWPHSAAGACGTPNQFQTPFYDGVFCRDDVLTDTASQVGVQAQVFTVVNDEHYYYPDLMHGMIVDGDYGADLAMYTGSTTGTSRDNEICSQYTPITWQADRKCHLISASSFDKMCADMNAQRDDMTEDLFPHGSRELVADHLAANNHNNLRA